jgi:uncharacterized RDD family membrane protein YckC
MSENQMVETPRLASRGDRWLAKFIDNVIAWGVLLSVGFVGERLSPNSFIFGVLGYSLYSLFADGLPGGQSLGKKVLKIAVVNKWDGKPAGYAKSLLRNFSLGALEVFDAVFIFSDSKRRLGDLIADTEVINVAAKQS